MRFDVVTLFPELFGPLLATSIVGRAAKTGALRVFFKSPRDLGIGRHKIVDDAPYGGGSGMVMRVDCVVGALEALDVEAEASGDPPRAHRVLLAPTGSLFTQRRAIALAAMPRVALVCGRYEGIDERITGYVDEVLSIGDFVLTGGEIAAMAIIDACARLLPGVLGNAESAEHESHSPAMNGLLEYPHYTRPVSYRGADVPEVLQNGNHAAIAAWRRAEAEARTRAVRPDLWAKITEAGAEEEKP